MLAGFATVLAACATAGVGASPGGAPALAPADEAQIKTQAMHGVREELGRNGLLGPGTVVIYLDTMVGPTPPEAYYDRVHRREWLAAMQGGRLVDALVGPRTDRRGLDQWGLVVEVGAPFPQGRDTIGVIYDWCLRRLPLNRGATGGNVKVWHDAFVRADTGWTRVGHAPAVAPLACTH